MEIRSYTLNGADWEWNGDGWDAEQFNTSGDFSAYDDGEPIKLVGYDDEDSKLQESVGIVRCGKFVDD